MDNGRSVPPSLVLLDQLSAPGSALRRQLCVAVSAMSQRIARDQQRALVQVWIPGFTDEGVIALSCQGAPYAIAGEGDLCALFRCVSCRFTFYPTSPDPKKRGSIGRVFHSHRPEISNNVSGTPSEIYHRADAARQCLLHSLCVMPLWLPEVSRKAPVAVLEVLQPDPQPDFDFLHSMAAKALREVTLTKATVTAPLPDPLDGMPTASSTPAAKGPGSPGKATPTQKYKCRTTQAGSKEERMQVVFDDRPQAENSGEHMVQVAHAMADRQGVEVSMRSSVINGHRQHIALENITCLPPVEGEANGETQQWRAAADDTPGAPVSASVGSAPPASVHSGNSGAAQDMELVSVRTETRGVTIPPRSEIIKHEDGGSPLGIVADAEVSGGGKVHLRRSSSHHSSMKNSEPVTLPDVSTGPPQNSDSPMDSIDGPAPVSSSQKQRNSRPSPEEVNVVGRPCTHDKRSPNAASSQPPAFNVTKAAVNETSKATSPVAGKRGNLQDTIEAIELLKVVQGDEEWQQASTAGGSLAGGSAAIFTILHSDDPTAKTSAAALKDNSSRKRRNAAHCSDATPQVNGRRQFGYPGGQGETFVRAGGVKGTLQDKCLRAETGSVLQQASQAHPPAANPPPGAHHGMPYADAPGSAPLLHPHHPPPQHQHHSAPHHPHGAAVYEMPPIMFPAHASLPVNPQTLPPGYPYYATPVHVHPGAPAHAMHHPTHPHQTPGPPLATCSAPLGVEQQALGPSGSGALPEDAKAIRNRLNRVDGGIGRKLTLDTLKLHFGKGLKEAAESLGMCPTTLKRACRRLNVKRWPRTPEAAAVVLEEAVASQAAANANSKGVVQEDNGAGGVGVQPLPNMPYGFKPGAIGGVGMGAEPDIGLGHLDFLDLFDGEDGFEDDLPS